jgi:hypothetical protein
MPCDIAVNLEKKMKRTVVLALALMGAAGLGVANMPGPPPTPSARLAIDVDVKPVDGKPGVFLLASTITDLETDAVIAKPQLTITAGKLARVEMGNEGKWMLQVSVTADGATRKAAYDAVFTREGMVVSRQRVSVNLNS